jgi:hypothetical protein
MFSLPRTGVHGESAGQVENADNPHAVFSLIWGLTPMTSRMRG